MTSWITLGPTRHQVAISGTVRDGRSGKAIAGARVEIIGAPPAFARHVALAARQYGDRWPTLAERLDRTRTTAAGHFHFLDLPDGEYTFQVSLPGAGRRYGKTQAMAIVARDGEEINRAVADAFLWSTTISGHITSAAADLPVVQAEVRLRGSNDVTWSDATGAYCLQQVEASRDGSGNGGDAVGIRRVVVSARGFERATAGIELRQPGDLATVDFALQPAGSAVFAPTDLSDCRLWLTADAINSLSSGNPIANWPDSSGFACNGTQAVVDRQPLFIPGAVNSLPAVRFDGVDDFMQLAIVDPSTAHSFFFVCSLIALGGHNNFLLEAESGRFSLDAARQADPHSVRWRDAGWHELAPAVTGWQILSWQFAGAGGEVWRNGVSLGSDAYTATSIGGRVALGASFNGTSSRFGGVIAEAIYFARTLSAGERRRVEQYLSDRYAIDLT